MHSVVVLGMLLSIPGVAIGADKTDQVRLRVDRKVPGALETVVAVPAQDGVKPGTAWVLGGIGRGDGRQFAQVEERDGTLWMSVKAAADAEDDEPSSLVFERYTGEGRVTVTKGKGGYWFLDHGRRVMFYRSEPKSLEGKFTRAGYVHPLLGLDGEELTQEFPADHRHHHGVFWAWHQFFVDGKQAGDPWETRGFLAVVRDVKVTDEGPLFAALKADVEWTSQNVLGDDSAPVSLVNEQSSIRVFHAAGNVQYIDFEIRLRANVEGVEIGGADNVKGYSGFTVRVKPPGDMAIRDEHGLLKSDSVGRASRWAHVTGSFGDGAASGIGVLSHSTLAEFPPRWLLRYYGMQNVVYPGRTRIKLPTDKPLVLKHRLVVHRGDSAAARIGDHQKVYEQSP